MSERKLTSGEITLAKKVFKAVIDYSKVKVHDGKYAFFQPNNSGMSPNGEIYIAGVYRKDYSSQSAAMQGFFIHEMVHVWQYQLNILNPITSAIWESIIHLLDYSKAYEYELDGTKDILDYKIEQQAAIIEDYFRIFHVGLLPTPSRIKNTGALSTYKPLYLQVLAKFLNNPQYARHEIVCKKKNYGHPSQRHIVCRRVKQI